MGFVRDDVEFTMDVSDTEVESGPIRAFLDLSLLVFVLKLVQVFARFYVYPFKIQFTHL